MSDIHTPPVATHLQRLFILRNVAVVGQITALTVAIYGLHISLPALPLSITIGLLALLNLLTWLRLGQTWPVTDQELFIQLLLDVAQLSALLFLSGGSMNPLISLYLMPISIAAVTLPKAYSWVLAAITVVCYSLLMFFYLPIPALHTHHASEINMHIHGMWFTFVLSAGLISYFVVDMSASLRERDRLLAQAREEALRNEQIIALGTLAAGAAHELGTPLGTMAIVVRELELDNRDQADVSGQLRILRDQVDNCKRILTGLLAQSGESRAEGGGAQPVDAFLQDILDKWQLMRPQTRLDYRSHGTDSAAMIITERTLAQAIMNLLNNAADASPDHVEVESRWSATELIIEIRDRGAGLTQDAIRNAGQAFFTTKGPQHGFGIGLFLSNASISRFGGQVSLYNREGGGACTRVVLPLAPQPIPLSR